MSNTNTLDISRPFVETRITTIRTIRSTYIKDPRTALTVGGVTEPYKGGFDMNDFSTQQPTPVTFDEDFLINMDSIQRSLYRIAVALEVIAGTADDE